MTSKLQVTLPKTIAERLGIRPGDTIRWEAADKIVRLIPDDAEVGSKPIEQRLPLFDQATERQRRRERGRTSESATSRGWTREELYTRDGSR